MTRALLFHACKWPFVVLLMSLQSGCAELNQFARYDYPPLDDFWGGNMTEPETKPAIKPETVSVHVHNFLLNGKDSIVGRLATVSVREDDTLLDIARHFGVGFQHIAEANPGVDIWVPQQGVRVVLPLEFTLPNAKPTGVVINLAAMRLFYFKSGKPAVVSTWPIGIGREGRSTPSGIMTIIRKMRHPTWYVPESIRRTHAAWGDPLPAVVPPGPDNPLGDFALYLSKRSYLIHGTNKPFSIGLRASNGCIRLYPEDIDHAYKEIPIGTPVNVVNQPYLLGWLNGVLYLEAHEPYEDVNAEAERKNLTERIQRIAQETQYKIDWPKVEETLKKRRGIPVPIFEDTATLKDLLTAAPRLERPAHLFGQPEKAEPGKVGWFIRTEATDEYSAKKLAAQMNHFGPRIPAYAIATSRGYQVVGGPFAQEQAAHKAQLALREDFSTKSEIIKLAKTDQSASESAASDAKKADNQHQAKPARLDPSKPAKAGLGKPAVGTEPAKPVKRRPGKPSLGTKPAKVTKAVKPGGPFNRKSPLLTSSL